MVFLRALFAGLDEISRDVDAEDIGSALRFGSAVDAVARTAEVEDFHSVVTPIQLDERVSALAHGVTAMRVQIVFSHRALFGLMVHSHRRRLAVAHSALPCIPAGGSGAAHAA